MGRTIQGQTRKKRGDFAHPVLLEAVRRRITSLERSLIRLTALEPLAHCPAAHLQDAQERGKRIVAGVPVVARTLPKVS